MNVRFEEEAWNEYQEAAQYSEDRFGLGRQFVAAVQVALSDIAKDPERYQRVGQRVHIFRMKRFPYYLFYQHDAEQETVNYLRSVTPQTQARLLAQQDLG